MYADELKFSVTEIKGIGRITASAMAKAGILTVSDLLKYIPRGYENRKDTVPLNRAPEQREINTVVEVITQDYLGYGKNKTLKVYVQDATATGVLICFGRNFLKDSLIPGRRFFLHAFFDYKYGEIQSTQFEFEPFSPNPKSFGTILPIYPLSAGLKQGILRKVVKSVLEKYAVNIENQLPAEIVERYSFPQRPEALYNIHFPKSLKMLKKSMNLLKYEELFYLQLIISRRAVKYRKKVRPKRSIEAKLSDRLIESLPFSLTRDQITVLKEIRGDMESERPMYRLLQGDVGSGKTLVAFIAALNAIEHGGQAAFMAPTELLARQHAENAAKYLSPLGVRLAFLGGNVKTRQRKNLLESLKAGEIDLLIGTHALFTKNTTFKNLEFVIVDEQHKFGVLQRLALLEKGKTPDLLLMTATPIPRTLTMTIFADLDVSTIKTMPKGRKAVITHLSKMENANKVYEAVRGELAKGRQAYFVYPRISKTKETESSELRDAETMYQHLRDKIYPEYSIGLIHSKIPDDDKMEIMQKFNTGEIHVLVATSVVEVGVDVKNATVMVIEHAERFGLSGLHQLRGRVGRGDIQSYAFLIYSDQLSETGKTRLKVMMKYNDGFSLAEEDLKIRGPGELAGKRQSGFLRFTFADIIKDKNILSVAKADALSVLKEDPGFIKISNSMIREVFNRCPPFEEDTLAGG